MSIYTSNNRILLRWGGSTTGSKRPYYINERYCITIV